MTGSVAGELELPAQRGGCPYDAAAKQRGKFDLQAVPVRCRREAAGVEAATVSASAARTRRPWKLCGLPSLKWRTARGSPRRRRRACLTVAITGTRNPP